MTALDELGSRLLNLPDDSTTARRWQVVRTETRRLMREHGMPGSVAAKWSVKPLPMAHVYGHKYGDCLFGVSTIRYRAVLVEDAREVEALAATIVHEVAHAVTEYELEQRHGAHPDRPRGGHGSMWRALAAAMGLRNARANSLPSLAGGSK